MSDPYPRTFESTEPPCCDIPASTSRIGILDLDENNTTTAPQLDPAHVAQDKNSRPAAAITAESLSNATNLNYLVHSTPFRTTTIAPSPPLRVSTPPPADTPVGRRPANLLITSSLSVLTDSELLARSSRPSGQSLQQKSSSSSLRPISRTPSVKAALAHSLGSVSGTSSTVASPVITALGDVTPLPSPLLPGLSPGPWRKTGQRLSSRDAMPSDTDPVGRPGDSDSDAVAPLYTPKRRTYSGLHQATPALAEEGDDLAPNSARQARNRSLSDYVPDPQAIPKRNLTVAGPHATPADAAEASSLEPHMRRELHFAETRGLTSATQPPTPPPSESSKDSTDSVSVKAKKPRHEYFQAVDRADGKRRRWRAVRFLGQGTFSRVILATSQMSSDEDLADRETSAVVGPLTPTTDTPLDRKTLVAVKICEHGPRGGANEERIEMSLRRELEIMKAVRHPSVVHLKAWSIEPTRTVLVLSYCPGGDLFDIATQYRQVLSPQLIRRIFAELVGALQYLHGMNIVHRDIKLENVLVNLPPSELSGTKLDWQTYPFSVITLTDLGLSRRVLPGEKLETRCGSDDYAAPEVIMGQSYDGMATDAWSLGVLLFALLESRLPFDPTPGISDSFRMRSRTSHRIARVEWRWFEYAGEDGDHDASIAKFQECGLLGAMEITEGLLKRARSRWTLDKVSETEWVKKGINLDGGPSFRHEDLGEEVR